MASCSFLIAFSHSIFFIFYLSLTDCVLKRMSMAEKASREERQMGECKNEQEKKRDEKQTEWKREEERESKSQRTGRREYIPQESRTHWITLKKNSSEGEQKE